jgi:Tfp pilus assembly protein PilF
LLELAKVQSREETSEQRRQAIETLDEAIQLAPGTFDLHVWRGYVYDLLHDREQALADLDEAIRLDDKDSYTFTIRAGIKYRRQDADGAIADFSAALRLDPKSLTALRGRAAAYHMAARWAEAVVDYRALDAVSPSLETSHYLANAEFCHGCQLIMIGDAKSLELAEQSFGCAANNSRLEPMARAWRALVYSKLGRQTDAAADLTAAFRAECRPSASDWSEADDRLPEREIAWRYRSSLDNPVAQSHTEVLDELTELTNFQLGRPRDASQPSHASTAAPSMEWIDAHRAASVASRPSILEHLTAEDLTSTDHCQRCANQALHSIRWRTPAFLTAMASAYAAVGAPDLAAEWQLRAILMSGDPQNPARFAILEQFRKQRLLGTPSVPRTVEVPSDSMPAK